MEFMIIQICLILLNKNSRGGTVMEVRNNKFTQNYTKVYCEDDWKFNAPHHFTISSVEGKVLNEIHFQEGPIKEVGINGVNNEDLLLAVVTRLEAFQNSDYRCDENAEAINAIYEAVDALRKRTNKRVDTKQYRCYCIRPS